MGAHGDVQSAACSVLLPCRLLCSTVARALATEQVFLVTQYTCRYILNAGIIFCTVFVVARGLPVCAGL